MPRVNTWPLRALKVWAPIFVGSCWFTRIFSFLRSYVISTGNKKKIVISHLIWVRCSNKNYRRIRSSSLLEKVIHLVALTVNPPKITCLSNKLPRWYPLLTTSKRNSSKKLSRSERRRPKKRRSKRRSRRKSLKRVLLVAQYLVSEANPQRKRLKRSSKSNQLKRKRPNQLRKRNRRWRMPKLRPIGVTTRGLKSSNNRHVWCKRWRINKPGCDSRPNSSWSLEPWLRPIRCGSSPSLRLLREIILLRAIIIISVSRHTNRKTISTRFLRNAIFKTCATTRKNTSSAKINNSYIRPLKKCRFKIRVLYSRPKTTMVPIVLLYKELMHQVIT